MKNIILFLLFIQPSLFAQPLVNVTFRHYPTSAQVVRAFVPGTFNGWGPNSSGFISPGAPSQMTFIDSLGFYVKTLSLKSGGEYNYKFHEQYNASGSEWQWFTDPLNPLINFQDNNNSIIRVKKAMLFEISPVFDAIITDPIPRLAAGVFTANGDSILADQSKVYLDGDFYTTFTGHVIPGLSILQLDLAGLSSGTHKVAINLVTRNGETAIDSTQFTFVSEKVYFLTPSSDSVWAAEKNIRWRINENASAISSITLQQLNSSPRTIAVQSEMDYTKNVHLSFGENRFVVIVKNQDGTTSLSDTLDLVYPEPQKPQPGIIFTQDGDVINVTGKANDPQNGVADFLWSQKPLNPEHLPGIDGTTDASFQIERPTVPGDYAFKLVVTDADGYSNSSENFFTVNTDLSITIPSLETIPSWVRNADIYCVFIKSLTAKGTLISAVDKLDHIKNMGFNTIWVLPVMDVEGVVDQGMKIGYNIVDFYKVEPAYGSNADFKNFVEEAHKRGLRVILDVTPNHSSRSHPIALDVRSKKKYSRYYDFYQHEPIPHDTNGLGQSLSSDGIIYYSGFSDALLNWNWGDAEAREYMLSVYKYWLREYDIDGFRFDVYWGPHRRYGVENFDHPLRRELRAAKADILLLGETDGTGSGTEENYADDSGGLDMAYDWQLKNTILSFPSINSLATRLYNSGYRPGPNSLFLRFLENQDEERVAYRYNSIEKTIPVSTAIFLATGSPLLYQGQEVGMGYKMGGGRDFRVRSTVNWENAPGKILVPHYQKLAQIRAQFPAFRRQMQDTNNDGFINGADRSMQPKLQTSDAAIYAFGRPFPDQNGVVVMNFSNDTKNSFIVLQLQEWAEFSSGLPFGEQIYCNNLYENTSSVFTVSGSDTLNFSLPPYGVAVYSISTKEEHVELPGIQVGVLQNTPAAKPGQFRLLPNYPNPFNPRTTIQYSVPETTHIKLTVYNALGQQVALLVNEEKRPGIYQKVFDSQNLAGGIYLYRIQGQDFTQTRKMVLLR